MKTKRIFIVFLLCVLGISEYLGHFNKDTPEFKFKFKEVELRKKEVKPSFLSKSPKDGLLEALEYYGVYYPEIVYAQAVLETGNFKSDLCINNNNLFGLYNSKKGKYYSYNHWSESVQDYVESVQYRYNPSSNYYKFLDDIGYASDPEYITKLKEIVNDKRRNS